MWRGFSTAIEKISTNVEAPLKNQSRHWKTANSRDRSPDNHNRCRGKCAAADWGKIRNPPGATTWGNRAGDAGLVGAAGGALLGGRVALLREVSRGDCLNGAAWPSKAIIVRARGPRCPQRREFGVRIRAKSRWIFPP